MCIRDSTPITQGSLTINGMNPNNVKGIIGYVPQKDQLNWNFPMTARQVVQMGITKNSSFNPFSTKKNRDLIEECLEKVSLLSMINNQVEDMSGGERQRVFLARTLAQGAEILLLDEVFSGVDVGSQE